jgi:two-component system sensor histidine kinase BaeS
VSHSITFRLILAFLLVGITVVALASGITYWLTVREFKQLTFDQSRDRFVADMAFYYQTNGTWDGVLDYYRIRASANSQFNPQPNPPPPGGPGGGQPQPQTFFFALADQGGRILIPAGDYQIGETIPTANLSKGTPINLNNVQVGTVVVLGSPPPLGPLEERYLTRTNLALLYAVLGASALALLLGAVLARALTHPIRDLTKGIHAIAKGDLKQYVTVKSKDELGELAAAFNQMSSDLDRLTRSRRQMTADIAHDLRNPLTVIGGYVESMREGVLKPIPERLDAMQMEVQHLERLVDDLRVLSQADAGELSLNRETVSIPVLLERTAQSYRALANKQAITLKIEVEPDLPEIHADPDRLAQVLGNLISNSLRYTPQGGEIVLRGRMDGKSVIITVADNGQGISSEALPYIFDRFYRADPSRTRGDESGLGLAIAKSIVEAHGGIINAESPTGQGTTIKIIVPIP